MKNFGINFQHIYDYCAKQDHKWLQEKAPLDEVILEMAIKHLPSPEKSQAYRIPVIWKGDVNDAYGKGMLSCDPNAKVTFMVTAIAVDEHAGDVAVGRIYSGTVRKGTDLYSASQYRTDKLQGVAIYMGPDRVPVDYATAGNIIALVGLKEVYAGETLSEGEMVAFEQIKHHSGSHKEH